MFIYNGIVYGKDPAEDITVTAIKALPDKMMLLTFSNNEERLFDATLLKGKVFEALDDDEIFSGAYIDHGVVTWMNGDIDCAPEYMYENSYEYTQKINL